MEAQGSKHVDAARAAVLLGMSPAQVLLLAEQAGIGHEADPNDSAHRIFTYEELYQMCRFAAHACA